jgi:hypothetical protein
MERSPSWVPPETSLTRPSPADRRQPKLSHQRARASQLHPPFGGLIDSNCRCTVVAQSDGVTRYRALKLPTVWAPDGDGTGGSRRKNDPARVTPVHEVSGDM